MTPFNPGEYASYLSAYTPEELWRQLVIILYETRWAPCHKRLNVLRNVLVIHELEDPTLRFEYDPSCYGLTGEALLDGMRVSARGGEYWEQGRAQVAEYYECVAELIQAEIQYQGGRKTHEALASLKWWLKSSPKRAAMLIADAKEFAEPNLAKYFAAKRKAQQAADAEWVRQQITGESP